MGDIEPSTILQGNILILCLERRFKAHLEYQHWCCYIAILLLLATNTTKIRLATLVVLLSTILTIELQSSMAVYFWTIIIKKIFFITWFSVKYCFFPSFFFLSLFFLPSPNSIFSLSIFYVSPSCPSPPLSLSLSSLFPLGLVAGLLLLWVDCCGRFVVVVVVEKPTNI